MAPTKNTRVVPKPTATVNPVLMPLARKALTRKSANTIHDQNAEFIQTRGKRKAEHSPVKNEKVKRSALGNLTNNVKNNNNNTQHPDEDAKLQLTKKAKEMQTYGAQILKEKLSKINIGGTSGTVTRQLQQQQQQPQQQQTQIQLPNKITTRATARNANINNNIKTIDENVVAKTTAINKTKQLENGGALAPPPPPPPMPVAVKAPSKPVRRISNEFNKTEDSLYMSALEDISSCESMRLSGNFEAAKRRSVLLQQIEKQKTDEQSDVKTPSIEIRSVPENVEDFDKINWNDPFQVSHYAMDIFNYLKEREPEFPIHDYMENQVNLSKWMRTLLIDWMVEVQETFELNHETLYLAVKIVDLYLCRVVIKKDKLQLLGAAALFIACKFDERTPPFIEDFLYICDGAYKQEELIKMEMTTLRTINYDLGMPLSYRFLRRYARCSKVLMPTLTLARYILELSLMDYATISYSDSKLAAAVLFMALRMHGDPKPWSATLEYYSGYKLSEFAEIVPVLNACLHRKPNSTVKTIRSKYSHKIFHEVAKVPLISTEQLFENNLDLNESIRDEQQQQSTSAGGGGIGGGGD